MSEAASVTVALNGLVPERQCSACGAVHQAGAKGTNMRMVALRSSDGPFAMVVTFACSRACDNPEGIVMGRTNAAFALTERVKLETEALNQSALPTRVVMV